ncbi:MAG: ferrochelatase [Hahellaceae bacterium]|nr:ferrochelatase [Hahellaceae bacterium]MCP5169255.1 ferrochelatase [Hahellaceae bacterium]
MDAPKKTAKRVPTAVLLLNLGTPDAPTKPAIRRYLKAFLSDPRVVEAPRLLWWLVLNLVILRFRPAKLVTNYQKIWTGGESPIRRITEQQAAKVQAHLQSAGYPVTVYPAMTYGAPDIDTALDKIASEGIERVVVLPLFPQYSATTTAAAWDALHRATCHRRNLPEFRFIKRYHRHPLYTEALAQSVLDHWLSTGRQGKLLFSFHGIPKAYIEKGDPYLQDCQETVQAVVTQLGLSEEEWLVSFQSRVGREEWLTPYTDETMKKLGQQGVKGLDVICPGFSADCLETLEEIDEENRENFVRAGGSDYHYIPALNDNEAHIQLLATVVAEHLY